MKLLCVCSLLYPTECRGPGPMPEHQRPAFTKPSLIPDRQSSPSNPGFPAVLVRLLLFLLAKRKNTKQKTKEKKHSGRPTSGPPAPPSLGLLRCGLVLHFHLHPPPARRRGARRHVIRWPGSTPQQGTCDRPSCAPPRRGAPRWVLLQCSRT